MTIQNVNKVKKQLKVAYRNSSVTDNKKKEEYVDSELKMPAGSIWYLTNEGSQPLYINFIINKWTWLIFHILINFLIDF